MKDFKKNIKKHLAKYNHGKKGIYKGNEYEHIRPIEEGQTQMNVIKEILKEDAISSDLFTSPQQYAHHLNSSQVVCYEFFRNMMDGQTPKEGLIDFLQNNCGIADADKFKNGTGKFEYVPDWSEYTNFDFYLEGEDDYKVYFEIKYTEDGFGKAKADESHKDKFKKVYETLFNNCPCVDRVSAPEFFANYQLYRNTLKVTRDHGKHEFVIFLFPRENDKAMKEFDSFKKFIKADWENNVKAVYWEDCAKLMSQRFRDKFFYYV